MGSITIKAVIVAFAISLTSSVAMAEKHGSMEGHGNMDHDTMNQSHSDHGGMEHSSMAHGTEGEAGKAMGVGVIHRVSKLNRTVNLTHEPIPALNWPEMTMDLPVAKSIDLGSIKTGEQVKFHIELGPDKKYIITDLM